MSQFNLSISPAQIEIILKANATYTRAYDITNNSSETILLSTLISPWVPADNQGSITFIEKDDSPLLFSLSNADLKLGQDFTIKPGQKKQLVLKIKNPSSEENDYYYTFFVTQKPINNTISDHQNLAKIGSNILISTTQQNVITANQEITNFSLKPTIKDVFSTIKIKGEVFNNGNHYSQINGQILITKNGQKYWEQNLFPYTIVKNNSRLLHCLNTNNEPSICQLKTPIWPGLYQGTITLNGNASKYEYSFQIFIFPYSIIVFILFVFFLLSFLLRNKQTVSSSKQ